MISKVLEEQLTREGYYNLKEIEGKGICGIMRFMFTFGLVYNLDEFGYSGRYCYQTEEEAQIALKHWDGKGYPLGRWIKHKGAGFDEGNPNL